MRARESQESGMLHAGEPVAEFDSEHAESF
jgi:hypothetical protein